MTLRPGTQPEGIKRILVVGEINVDLVFQGCQAMPQPGSEVLAEGFRMTPGSSSMICAMGLARLGNPVTFHGKVGADEWGSYCLRALDEAGIGIASIQPDASLQTGLTVSLSTLQDRALVTYPGAMLALRAEDVDDALLAAADHLHVSSYYLQPSLRAGCAELFARAHATGLTTSLDPGFDPQQAWGADLNAMLREVDVFLPNEKELAAISSQSTLLDGLYVLDNGRTLTVVKRGGLGCASLHEGQWLEVPAYPVDALDSTGERVERFDNPNLVSQVTIGMDVLRKLHLYIAFNERKLYITAAAPAAAAQPATAP